METFERDPKEIKALQDEVEQLRALCNQRVDGERPGDTLIRLAHLICYVGKDPSQPDANTADWKEWLRDFARQLNNTTEPSGKDKEGA